MAWGQDSASSAAQERQRAVQADLGLDRDGNLSSAVGGDPDSAVSQRQGQRAGALLLARCLQAG